MASDTDTAPPPKKSRKRLVLVAAGGALLLAGGGAGAWYLRGGSHSAPAQAASAPARKPVFSVLEPFTVNLSDDQGDRFAQVGVTLEIESGDVDTLIKDHLPAVRNNVLLLLASKRVEELLSPEGKQKLAGEVRQKVIDALVATGHGGSAGEAPVRSVLFSQFIVQ